MLLDETQLLLRMRRGDEAAASELWRRLAPRLIAYARAILGRRDPQGGRDVVQSVFLAALRAPRSEVRRIENVPGWLLVLTRNTALNRLRSLRREQARVSAAGPADRPEPRTSGHAPNDPTELARALERLPRPMREVVTLKHLAGLTFDQIALAVGANRSTLASRYRVALDRLRTMLSEPDRMEVSHARA